MKWYSRPSFSPSRGARVVYEMESRMFASRLSSASTRLVFPAPDGATTTKTFPLLNVLDLLAHLLDQHLQLDRDSRDLVRDRLRAEGVRFAIQLLAEEV